jgi:diacylglycerol kinase (ATP)
VDKVKVILNPAGGRWAGQVKIDRVEQALRAAGIDYHLEPTAAPAHGIELARQASQEGWPIVVAAGGDGLISEVVNGLMQAAGENEAGTLGIIPLGTANDLPDMLALPRDITVACQRLVAGNTRLIDVGQVNGHYFANNSAVGLEPMVTLAHEQMRWLKGDLRYLLAALKTIAAAQSWSMRLNWDNGEYDGPVTLVSVGNSPRTGGLFYMTPQAVLDDGFLDFVCAQKMSRWQMLGLLPQTFKGNHIHHPLVIHQRTTTLSITASPPTPIQADGEIIDKNATEINYRIIPNKLRVIV